MAGATAPAILFVYSTCGSDHESNVKRDRSSGFGRISS